MLSPVDVAVIGVAALLLFGPDQLPKVARKVGSVMRDVQNTSQTFIREMEKAAEIQHPFSPSAWEDSTRHEAPESAAAIHEPVESRGAAEPFAHESSANGTPRLLEPELEPAHPEGTPNRTTDHQAGEPGAGAGPGGLADPARGADFSI